MRFPTIQSAVDFVWLSEFQCPQEIPDNLPPVHPGVFLRDELDALDLSARKFAEHIHVPHNAVTGIMNGDRSISARMAIRLGKAFGTTAQYWLNLQTIYDLKIALAESLPAIEKLQDGKK